ncbi:MAG: asparaginase [Deltaproteobacteria bacterium]|nr:asparaginase [Deltaproteobacteria bacterium]
MPKPKPRERVALFFTGGTITMKPASGQKGVAPSRAFERFFSELDPLVKTIQLEPLSWANLPSPHMTPEKMFQLAKDVDQKLRDPACMGAVVIHGTDVLVESAYMADLVVETEKPVIFTGSMRYYSEAGYDGIRNLLNGIKACLLPMPPEHSVALLMTDRIFSVREVIKVNALKMDAFEAPESGPVAYVAGDTLLLTRGSLTSASPKRPRIRTRAIESRVALVSCYTGMDDGLIRHLHQTGVSGLVVEGFGAGNVPPGIVSALEKMIHEKIPVVLTTQCAEGRVWPIYGYPGGGADLVKKGVLLGGRLTGAKARILLMAALGAGMDVPRIRELFENVF